MSLIISTLLTVIRSETSTSSEVYVYPFVGALEKLLDLDPFHKLPPINTLARGFEIIICPAVIRVNTNVVRWTNDANAAHLDLRRVNALKLWPRFIVLCEFLAEPLVSFVVHQANKHSDLVINCIFDGV